MISNDKAKMTTRMNRVWYREGCPWDRSLLRWTTDEACLGHDRWADDDPWRFRRTGHRANVKLTDQERTNTPKQMFKAQATVRSLG